MSPEGGTLRFLDQQVCGRLGIWISKKFKGHDHAAGHKFQHKVLGLSTLTSGTRQCFVRPVYILTARQSLASTQKIVVVPKVS